MEPTKRKAGRPPGEKKDDQELVDLKITKESDRLLTAHSNKLKVSKRKYVNAAIAYFAETGLNPTKERPQGLANVSAKVSQETRAVRELNVEIGQRVITIIRGWEKTLYGFLQQQQAGTVNYLQQIESNILAHQVEVESTLLAPMVEQLFKVNLEAFIARALTTRLLMKVTDQEEEGYQSQMEKSDSGRDQQLAMKMREFIATNSVAKPTLSPKPQVPAVPAKAPMLPAAATTAAAVPPK